MQTIQQAGGAAGNTDVEKLYNIRDSEYGYTPVFCARTGPIVELFLRFEDLHITAGNGGPLLWVCARWGAVTEKVLQDERLRGQLGMKGPRGELPLQGGECIALMQIENAVRRGECVRGGGHTGLNGDSLTRGMFLLSAK